MTLHVWGVLSLGLSVLLWVYDSRVCLGMSPVLLVRVVNIWLLFIS